MNPHLSDLISDCERVPLLQAYAVNENTVCLILDGHLGLELGETDACAIIPFILDCIETASRR